EAAGMPSGVLCPQHVEFGIRLSDRDTRLQTPEYCEHRALQLRRRRCADNSRGTRNPNVCVWRRKPEVRRQHADYSMWTGIEHQRLTQHSSLGTESALPQIGTDHSHFRSVGPVLFRHKAAADQGCDAENVEKVRRHTRLLEYLRLSSARKRYGV